MVHADPSSGWQAVLALSLGGGIAAGALVGWALGPARGPALLARVSSGAALAALAALLASSVAPPGLLLLLAPADRATLAAALGFLCGGLTQNLAVAWSSGGERAAGGQGRALVLASLLCAFLWLLSFALLAVPFPASG